MARKQLPLVIDLPEPCQVGWDEMDGNERRRTCDRCEKTVVNLSPLSRAKIEAVLQSGACISFEYREGGTVVTADDGRPVEPSRRKRTTPVAGVVLAASLAASLGCNSVGRTTGEPPALPAPSASSASFQAAPTKPLPAEKAEPQVSPITPVSSAAATKPLVPRVAPTTPANPKIHRTAGVPMPRPRDTRDGY